ncbi:MAG: molybdopterin-guanine dinucleotide biosynthesis protein B [Thermoplasmata archaeon]
MILGVYGYQDSGKTAIVEAMANTLVARGYKVASVKHAPETTDIDPEGKDTWRHWKAGSDPVALQAGDATVVLKRPGFSLDKAVSLLQREARPDIVIIEGYKDGSHPKVAVGDIAPTEGTVLVNPTVEQLTEYIEGEISFERTRARLPGLDCTKCGMDCDELAREVAKGSLTIEACLELPEHRVEISVGGVPLPVGAFVAEIAESTIRGLLSSLKGYSQEGEVEIRLRPQEPPTRNGDRSER